MGKNNPLNAMFGAFGPTFTVVGTIAMVVALIIWATVILPTDLETTRIGYLASPTVKINSESVATAVSALIFSLQIIGMFGMLKSDNNKRSRIFAVVAIFSLLYDMYTDMIAKFPSELGTNMLYIALNHTNIFVSSFLETLLIFTLLSEVLASILIEEIVSVFPAFISGMGQMSHNIMGPISDAIRNVFGDDGDGRTVTYQKSGSNHGNSNGRSTYASGNKCRVCGAPTTNGNLCRRHELEEDSRKHQQQGKNRQGGSHQNGNMTFAECPRCGFNVPYGLDECPKCHVELVWED